MKTKLLLLLLLGNFSIYAQYTSIPDINFEKKLIALGIDSGTPDGKVLIANVSGVTSLSISSSDIADLTGIQEFVALKTLYCDNNRIRTLDLSKNVALTELRCFYNRLISLNLKTGKKLSYLDVDTTNNFTLECILVDNVALTQNWRKKTDVLAKFNDVACYTYTKIPDENFEKKLIALGIDTDGKNGKVITSNIASITTLDISYSGIADLTGIEDFSSLTNLNFAANALKYFDPSIIIGLRSLDCSLNLLTTLNITKNTNLSSLNCSKNNLLTLNLQNGQNNSLLNLNIKSNSNLPCVLVDNAAYATANWIEKDLATIFNETVCTPAYTLIPDANFENRLIALGIDTDGKNGKVITSNIAGVTSLDVSGKFITNLTGIQDFKALKTLDCSNNRLPSLDVTKNIALENLNSNTNYLTGTIDLSKNVNLMYFNASTNQLSTLDFSKNIALKEITCSVNVLTSINVSQNFALTKLTAVSNKLTSLDLSKNVSLNFLFCDQNQLTSLDLSNNALLEIVICKANKLTDINVSQNLLLHQLDLENNLLPGIDVSKNLNLVWLLCNQNKLTKLDVSLNKNLTWLNCSSNELTTLDVSKNTALDYFYCGSNKNLVSLNLRNGTNKYLTRFSSFYNTQLACILVDDAAYSNANWSDKKDENIIFSDTPCSLYTLIPDVNFENKLIALGLDSNVADGKVLTANIAGVTTLDISSGSIINLTGIQDFTALKDLKCNLNQIKDLDLSKNLVLNNLDCSSNKLTNLDVSKNVALKKLNCSSNQLTALNIAENVLLANLDCHSNQIISLDIAANSNLTNLSCNDNKLSTLNLKNKKNNLLVSANFQTNPDLSCILVDDTNYSNLNWIDFKDNSATYNTQCLSPYTLIPDVNFENKLIALGIDTDGKNGKVLTASIKNITSLNVSASSITNLTGLEDFESLTNLNCQNNLLTNLNVSGNIALTDLNCYHNPLANLNLTNNYALLNLSCGSNQLSNLDLSANTDLINLDCSSNKLMYLDLSRNNGLSTLDCNSNFIKKLDFSKNTKLTALNCSNNNLVNLNIKNGKNTQLSTYNFKLNASLGCIQVDNTSYSNTNWIAGKDNTALYNETSCTAYTLIPDANFESYLVKFGFDNDGYNGKVATENIKSIKTMYIDNNSIADFTGIEDFVSLTLLDCSSNALTTLDLSKNTALTSLNCSGNRLTNLNISKNTALKSLNCSNIDNHYNQGLTNLDISKNTALTSLTLVNSRLTTLDISKNTALTELDCYQNLLTKLDVSNNTVLAKLSCSKNVIKKLDLTNNPALIWLKCNDNKLTELNLKNGKNNLLNILETSFQTNPDLSCIQVDNESYSNTNWAAKKDASASYSNNCGIPDSFTLLPDNQFEKKLIALGIDTDGENGKIENTSINKITSLNLTNSNIKDLTGIENFTALTFLDCSNNQLSTLDVSHNVFLETLNASSNQITALDVSKNSKLTIVYVVSNPLTSLNLQNGNNKNFILPTESAKKSASLYTSFLGLTALGCIQVDDENYSNANWLKLKEASTTYSNNCKKLGVEESVFDAITMYPNPTTGEVNINNIILEKAAVYNSLGQLVKTFTLNSGNTNNTINLSGLPKGIYYVYLINQDAASAKKIIIR